MALEQKLRLKLAQRLVMTPSLQQAIKLLQLSRLELEETLSQEILENPVLDVDQQDPQEGQEDEPQRATADAAATENEDAPASQEETYNDIDVEAFFSDYLADSRTEGPSMAARSADDVVMLENTVSVESGLFDHLVWQLHLVDCDERLLPACEYIIGNLDESDCWRWRSRKSAPTWVFPPRTRPEPSASCNHWIRPGSPPDRSQECLLIQLDRLEEEGSELGESETVERARTVIADHWDDLLHQRWDPIAKGLACSVSELRPILDIIHRLEMKPGREYEPNANSYIEPDVHVSKVDGEFVIHTQ
jgi:RNA polymerase sigma-54 factor